ncbi:MAG: polymer-forming cytoskeletal protein [Lachnospiraceae bacterium]|nr:polymer-forming cytoskeletal protein [Lachnospiraceae bacterium]
MVEEALAETISELPLVEEEPVETLMMDESILAEEGLAEEIQVELPDDATSVETMESDTPDGVVNELREEVQEGMSEEVMEEVLETNEVEQEQGGEETIMDTQPKVASDETAVVTEGMSIIGDITSGGSLELLGAVTGNIDVLGKLNITGSIQGNSKAAEIFAEGARINGEINSQGSVKIGQSSVIIGNIYANSAVIAGAVKGDIDVHGPVVLDTSAIVMGNIKSKSVQINNGAVIEGMCSQCYAEINPTSFFEEIKKKKDKK